MIERREPLEPEIEALLERVELEPVPPRVGERILASVAARVAALPPAGRGAGHSSRSARQEPTGFPARPTRLWGVSASSVAALGAAFALGVVGGGVLLRRPPVERIVYVDRPVVTVVHDGAPVASAVATTELPVVDGTTTNKAHAEIPAGGVEASSLAAESALLDVARAAVANGQSDQALAAIDRHASRFSRGILTEEREALAVRALVMAGRGAEARARALAFQEAYPKSLFAPVVRAAIDRAPR